MTLKAPSAHLVRVRAYVRKRNGSAERVRQHIRSQHVAQLTLALGSASARERSADISAGGEGQPDGIRMIRTLSGALPAAQTTEVRDANMPKPAVDGRAETADPSTRS